MTDIANGRISLGNLAAIGLRKNNGPDSLWASSDREGRGKGDRIFPRPEGLARDGRFPPATREIHVQRHRKLEGGYAVAVEIDAAIDPKVIIGGGTVFEQLTPDRYRTSRSRRRVARHHRRRSNSGRRPPGLLPQSEHVAALGPAASADTVGIRREFRRPACRLE